MLSISSDAEELAHRIARKTGKSPEEVIRDSLDATARALGVTDDDDRDISAKVAAAEAIVRSYQFSLSTWGAPSNNTPALNGLALQGST